MEIFRNDVKAGIFIVIAFVLFLYGLFQVGGIMDRMKPGRVLAMNFQNAQRVQPGTEIIYRGKKIGSVKDVVFVDGGHSVNVMGSILPEVTLLRGTTAHIMDKSALGGKIIELKPGGDSREIMTEDEVMPGMAGAGLTELIANLNKTVLTLDSRLEGLIDKVEKVLVNLDEATVLASDRLHGLQGLGVRIDNTLRAFSDLAQSAESSLGTLTTNVNDGMNKVVPKADETLEEIRKLAVQLQGDVAELKTGINQVMEDTGQTLSGANDLMSANQKDLRESLHTLNITLRYLETFSRRIAERPSSLIWKGRPENLPRKTDEERFREELGNTGLIDRKGNQ